LEPRLTEPESVVLPITPYPMGYNARPIRTLSRPSGERRTGRLPYPSGRAKTKAADGGGGHRDPGHRHRLSRGGLEQPEAEGAQHGPGAVTDPELGEDGGQVVLHRARRQVQRGGDL